MQYTLNKIIFFVILFIIYLIIRSTFRQRPKKLKEVRNYSNKILVNLDECELINSDYTNEEITLNIANPLGTLSNMDFYSQDSYINNIQSIYVKYSCNGRKYIAGPINKSEIAVRFIFIEKKTTYIYYNKSKPEDYYFDLSFIHSQ